MQGDSPGSLAVDLDQEIQFIGVAINDTWIESRVGMELLPGGEMVVVRPSSHSVPVSIFRPLIDHVGTVRVPQNGSGVNFTEEGRGYRLIVPDPRASDAYIVNIRYFMPYDDSEEMGFFDRDRTHLPQKYADIQSDHLYEWPKIACLVAPSDGCNSTAALIQSTGENSTPSVHLGLHFVEGAVGTDPSFRTVGAIGDREAIDAPEQRASTPGPPGRLSLEPTPANPLPIAAGGAGSRDPAPAAPGPARSVAPPLPKAGPEIPPPPPRGSLPLLAAAVSFALAVLLASLYSRLSKEDERSGRARERILAVLQEDGPLSLTRLGERVGLDRTTVTYHVRRLQRIEALQTTRRGSVLLVHLPGQAVEPHRVLAGRGARALLEALRACGGETTRSLLHAACATIPHRTRNRALLDLVEAGLVERTFRGNQEIVRLRDATN